MKIASPGSQTEFQKTARILDALDKRTRELVTHAVQALEKPAAPPSPSASPQAFVLRSFQAGLAV